MDGILSNGQRGRVWMCKKKNGHALGIIIVDRQLVEHLLLFRKASDVEPVGMVKFSDNVKTIGAVEGTVHEIECDICGSKRTWWMDKRIAVNLLAPMFQKVDHNG